MYKISEHKKNILLWCILIVSVAAIIIVVVKNETVNEKKQHIIYIPKTIDENNDFWTQLIEGVHMAGVEKGLEVSVVSAKKEEDYEMQNELILWAIEQKPDAILLSPSNYTETTPYAKKIKENGIPLILIDSAIDEEIADTMIATNNISLGEAQGSFMKQFVDEDSKIAIIGHVKNSSTAIERENGVRIGLEEDADRIVDVVFCDSDYDKAYQLLLSLLEKYPDINLVAGLNEYSAVGAARAIKDQNLKGKIKVFGTDSSLEEIQLLEEGIFEGIIIQNPFKMGYMGVEAAVKILKGEEVPAFIDAGCELITKDNLYTEENQKLLFPFKEE